MHLQCLPSASSLSPVTSPVTSPVDDLLCLSDAPSLLARDLLTEGEAPATSEPPLTFAPSPLDPVFGDIAPDALSPSLCDVCGRSAISGFDELVPCPLCGLSAVHKSCQPFSLGCACSQRFC